MAKARLSVNDEEARIVERARALSKLQAKRRQKVDELAALDKEIEGVKQALSGLIVPASSDSRGYGHGV